MKHYAFVLTLLLLSAGCNNPPKLKITDLKFGGFEKEHISINKIDTIFLISGNVSMNLGESDTFGYNTYDKAGNLLIEWRRVFMGHDVEYDYDSNGLVKYKDYGTDFSAKFKPTYKFIADSLLLYQFWTGNDNDTCVFKFDKTGNLIAATEYANNDQGKGKHYKTMYEYNPSGQLIRKKVALIVKKEWLQKLELDGESISTENLTDFFYSGNKPDSAITTFYFPTNAKRNYTSKTFFNSMGIRDTTVTMDTIITRYAYRKSA